MVWPILKYSYGLGMEEFKRPRNIQASWPRLKLVTFRIEESEKRKFCLMTGEMVLMNCDNLIKIHGKRPLRGVDMGVD
jgi:hypothetical protein